MVRDIENFLSDFEMPGIRLPAPRNVYILNFPFADAEFAGRIDLDIPGIPIIGIGQFNAKR